jgi:hypothetical protein
MISLRQRILWAGLLSAAAFTSSGAFAQAPAAAAAMAPAAEAPAGAAPHAQHQRMDPAQRMARMQAFRTKRLAALKDKLKLSAAQESAWTTFTASSQPSGQPPKRFDRAEFAKLTTPERLDRMQARMTERGAMVAKRAEATRTFYAALTPEQQKTFDAESMHFGPRGAHGHPGRHGHQSGAPAKS